MDTRPVTAGPLRATYNLDSELRFLSANDLCLSLWDKRLEELIGRKMTEVFPQVVGSEGYEAQIQAMRSLAPYRGVIRSVIVTGEVDLEVYPSRDGLRISFAPLAAEPHR